MKLTQLFCSESGDGRGVSPVIGVILMVAITVILAAVIATFVLGLGDQIQSSPQAGASFGVNDGTVTTTYVSEGNLDSNGITIGASGDCDVGDDDDTSTEKTIGSVGGTEIITDCTSGDTITVRGTTPAGTEGVVAQYTYQG